MKHLTLFVLDHDRDPADPLVLHVSAVCPADLLPAAQTAFASHMFECGAMAESDDACWNRAGAVIIGIVPGHLSVIWNPDACGAAEFNAAFKVKP